MEIEYVRRFITLSQSLNFCKAADALFISQPTLSHSIMKLEKDLGVTLFVRNTTSVKLTHAGECFLPAASEIVRLYDDVRSDLASKFTTDCNQLLIGYIGPALDNMLPPWIKKFRDVSPDVVVHVTRYPGPAIKEAFETRAIQLGILYEMNTLDIPDLRYQQVAVEKFKLLINAAHPLAKYSCVELSKLKDEPFLICDRTASPQYYDCVMRICERRGYVPNIKQKARLVSDLYSLVGAGLGIAILSYSETRPFDAYGVKFVNIGTDDKAEDLTNRVVIAWKRGLSPAARQFKQIATDMTKKAQRSL